MSDWRDGAPPEARHRLTDCCARCGELLTPERRSEHYVGCLYCVTCLPLVNKARTVNAPPLARSRNGAILYDPRDLTYGQGAMPLFSSKRGING